MPFTSFSTVVRSLLHWAIFVASLAAADAWAATPMLSAGDTHTCALFKDGTVQCFGSNGGGQLGVGNNGASATPRPIAGLSDATHLATSQFNTCAVRAVGSVLCWGYNGYGQLGNGTKTDSSIPVTVAGISNATFVAVGESDACAVLSDGNLQCWGARFGTRPTSVQLSAKAVSVAVGSNHSCVVLDSGLVQCWGSNVFGQHGVGTTSNTSIKTLSTVLGIQDARSVSAFGDSTCAVLADGRIQCWGYNSHGQLGDGTKTQRNSPVSVLSIVDAQSVSVDSSHACAVSKTGEVRCWGEGLEGELGNLIASDSPIPVLVTGVTASDSVATGRTLTCVAQRDGVVKCFGRDGVGIRSWTPVTVLGAYGIGSMNLTAGPVSDEDKVFYWAEKTYPQIFQPAGQATQSMPGYRYRSYAAGGHYLAVNDSGTPNLYYLGPLSGNTVLNLGLLSNWLTQAGL